MISGAGGFEVRLPVGGIVVLVRIEVEVRIGRVDLAARRMAPSEPFRRIGENHLRAVGLQDPLALLGGVAGRHSFTRYPRAAPIMA